MGGLAHNVSACPRLGRGLPSPRFQREEKGVVYQLVLRGGKKSSKKSRMKERDRVELPCITKSRGEEVPALSEKEGRRKKEQWERKRPIADRLKSRQLHRGDAVLEEKRPPSGWLQEGKGGKGEGHPRSSRIQGGKQGTLYRVYQSVSKQETAPLLLSEEKGGGEERKVGSPDDPKKILILVLRLCKGGEEKKGKVPLPIGVKGGEEKRVSVKFPKGLKENGKARGHVFGRYTVLRLPGKVRALHGKGEKESPTW